jgi:hypothetical protein
MNACVIFDVASRHNDVKLALKGRGYLDVWGGADGNIFRLPSNALWKPNCELSQAKAELQNVVNMLSSESPATPIILLRCIVLPVNPWEAIPGIPENG